MTLIELDSKKRSWKSRRVMDQVNTSEQSQPTFSSAQLPLAFESIETPHSKSQLLNGLYVKFEHDKSKKRNRHTNTARFQKWMTLSPSYRYVPCHSTSKSGKLIAPSSTRESIVLLLIRRSALRYCPTTIFLQAAGSRMHVRHWMHYRPTPQ